MTDFIKRSIELDAWLKAQDITVEPDEFAPILSRWEERRYGREVREVITVTTPHNIELTPCLCPYFGPGGADNLLKALRAWCEKNSFYLALEDTQDGKAKWLLISEDTVDVGGDHLEPPQPEPALLLEGEGKTDGEALSALLENLMEEKI